MVRAWAQSINGESTKVQASTRDLQPGIVTSLQILETSQDGFTASWCPPSTNPQCARTWDMNTKEKEVIRDSYSNSKSESFSNSLEIILFLYS